MCTKVAFVTQVCASVVFAICIKTGWRFVREANQNTAYSKLIYAMKFRTEIRAACDSAKLIQMLCVLRAARSMKADAPHVFYAIGLRTETLFDVILQTQSKLACTFRAARIRKNGVLKLYTHQVYALGCVLHD